MEEVTYEAVTPAVCAAGGAALSDEDEMLIEDVDEPEL